MSEPGTEPGIAAVLERAQSRGFPALRDPNGAFAIEGGQLVWLARAPTLTALDLRAATALLDALGRREEEEAHRAFLAEQAELPPDQDLIERGQAEERELARRHEEGRPQRIEDTLTVIAAALSAIEKRTR